MFHKYILKIRELLASENILVIVIVAGLIQINSCSELSISGMIIVKLISTDLEFLRHNS